MTPARQNRQQGEIWDHTSSRCYDDGAPVHGNAVGQAREFKLSDVERRRWCGDQPLGKIAESGNNHHVGDSLPFFREKGESVPVGQSMTADAPEHAGFRDAGKRDLDDRP